MASDDGQDDREREAEPSEDRERKESGRSAEKDDRKKERRERSRDRDDRKDRKDKDRDEDRGKKERRDKDRRRRSRSRSKGRSRSRSRSRSRDRAPAPRAPARPAIDPAVLAQWQMQQQQQLLAQQLMIQQAQMAAAQMAGASKTSQLDRKLREVYVGNLTIGVVGAQILTDLFNSALATLLKPGDPPAVTNVNLDSQGRFAFVECRTEELATQALALDKVELCGRAINVGRPKGYVDPGMAGMGMGGDLMGGMAANPALALAAAAAAASTNMMVGNPLAAMNPALMAMAGGAGAAAVAAATPQPPPTRAGERDEVRLDVGEECGKYGKVEGCAVPEPPDSAIAAKEHGRVYVLFDSEDSCKKARDALNGRTFDGNKVIATFVSAEDFARAQQGEWLAPPPEDEGVVRLRGLAPTTGKVDIASLFADLALAPLRDQDVRLVVGPNGQPSGDAYVLLRGSGWQRALLKNGAVLQSRLVEVAASNLDEVMLRLKQGTVMV